MHPSKWANKDAAKRHLMPMPAPKYVFVSRPLLPVKHKLTGVDYMIAAPKGKTYKRAT